METLASLLCAVLLAVDQPAAAARTNEAEAGDTAEEPEGGAGISPVELIPRIELRQAYQRLDSGVSVHDSMAEIDIQFLRRILLRYQMPYRTVVTPMGRVSGLGDLQLSTIIILASDATRLIGLVGGAVLDTAAAPELGTGKQQVSFGVGGAFKPWRWLLTYAVVQDQRSVGGNSARQDIDTVIADLGAILFGRQYNWLKVDLVTTVDLKGSTAGRFFGTLEVGSLVIGRVGLFMRGGTQFVGPALLDFSVAGGVRYLFRLEKGRPR